MRWPLILLIRIYWRIPARFKRRCLFRETCSLHVMRATDEGGLVAGCRALGRRFVRCRPRYSVYYDSRSRDWQVRLANGTAVESAEVADFVLEPYRAAMTRAEAKVRAGVSDGCEVRV